MRFIIYGAGAVGGVIGARLHQHGYDVILIARGAHLEAIQRAGLTLRTPAETTTLPIPTVASPADIDWQPGDVVILCMKGQDTVDALNALRAATGDTTPIVCCQNGVANEREAIRRFSRVYAMPVMLPATHLEPGVVQADSRLATGILDIGRYPTGTDTLASEIAAALAASTFSAEPRETIMDWKYSKLLSNLNNSIEAICGAGVRIPEITKATRAEGEAAYRAAGIPWVDPEVYAERRKGLIEVSPIDFSGRSGNSSWQSLARGNRSIEADYLNGEIALLGRLQQVPTPANTVLQRTANRVAHEGLQPGAITPDALLADVEAETNATT